MHIPARPRLRPQSRQPAAPAAPRGTPRGAATPSPRAGTLSNNTALGSRGRAVAAPLEVQLLARRHRAQSGGRHAARAAAPPAEHRERLRKVGVAVREKARDVQRGGPLRVCLGAVGAALEEHLHSASVAPDHGAHERREARASGAYTRPHLSST